MKRLPSLRPPANLLATIPKPALTTTSQTRAMHQTNPLSNNSSNQRVPDEPTAIDDTLAEGDARGRTGGGKPLEKGVNPPPKPKISNSSVPGQDTDSLTEEQQREVDQHNEDFEKKHDRAAPASDDKVNKRFWSGESGSK